MEEGPGAAASVATVLKLATSLDSLCSEYSVAPEAKDHIVQLQSELRSFKFDLAEVDQFLIDRSKPNQLVSQGLAASFRSCASQLQALVHKLKVKTLEVSRSPKAVNGATWPFGSGDVEMLISDLESCKELFSRHLLQQGYFSNFLCHHCKEVGDYLREDQRYCFDTDPSNIASATTRISAKYALSWICRMCMTIRRTAITDSYTYSKTPPSFCERLECQWSDIRGNSPFYEFGIDVWNGDGAKRVHRTNFKRWRENPYSKYEDSQDNNNGLRVAHTFEPAMWDSTSSSLALKHARQWISQCDECHDCLPSIEFIPTRLLDVGDSQSSGSTTLVEGKDLGKAVRYAVLSHCWGGLPKPRLVQQNIEAFKQGLDIDQLPQTFRDAIKVTRELGLQYLWIDALCITQDSLDDWTCEAAMMHNVYWESYINISASASKDSTRGLFRTRPPWWDITQYSYLEDAPQGRMFPGNSWKMPIAGPLSKRAWVFQEHILSSRILHFTETEIFWECKSLRASETCPRGLFRNYSNPSLNFSSFDDPVELDDWPKLVQEYTRRLMTVESDRHIAISAIAKRLQKNCKLSEDDYIGGSWLQRLTGDLLWHSNRGVSANDNVRIQSWPSWSWVSIPWGVSFYESSGRRPGHFPNMHYQCLDLYSLLHVKRQNTGHSSATSGLATLVISGPLVPIHNGLRCVDLEQSYDTRYGRIAFIAHDNGRAPVGHAKAEVHLDGDCDAKGTYFFAPMRLVCINFPWQRQLDISIEGLVLQQVDSSEPKYVRVGVSMIQEYDGSYKDLEQLLFDFKLLDEWSIAKAEQSEKYSGGNAALRKPRKVGGKLRDDEYFSSKVLMLTRKCRCARVRPNVQLREEGLAGRCQDHMASDTAEEVPYVVERVGEPRIGDEHEPDLNHEFQVDERLKLFCSEGDGKGCPECLYKEEEEQGRGFPSPFPSKAVQFENLRCNINEWRERKPGWQTYHLV